jgi:activator of HSP90 ATPase
LISKLSEFPKVLVETHGRDLTVGSETATPSESRSDTPAPAAGPAAKAAPAKATAAAAKVINTSTVSVEASFMASAVDLFEFLTDEKKIPIWSRAPAKVSSFFELFGHPLSLRNHCR